MNYFVKITPKNAKGQKHGYWEYYSCNNILWFKCFYHNGKEIGYAENYHISGKLSKKYYL